MGLFKPVGTNEGTAERVAMKGVEVYVGSAGVNTAHDTGILDVSGVKQVGIHVLAGGTGPLTGAVYGVRDDGTTFYLGAISGAVGGNGTYYTVGGTAVPSGNYLAMVLPRRIKVVMNAVAATSLISLTIHGR
jgi:hypothetical protein